MSRRRSKKSGPQFVRFFGPLLEALKQLGGSGRPAEVKDVIASTLSVSEDEQNERLTSGAPRFGNQVDWARFYLAKAGYLDSSNRGVWSLTTKGKSSCLSPSEALAVFDQVQSRFRLVSVGSESDEGQSDVGASDTQEPTDFHEPDHRRALIDILCHRVTPEGFERITQRLLREAGFQQVEVTQRSRDQGIDGHGILQINPMVSLKVVFQCKRYSSNPVRSEQVRDFRGAMLGRADKGIIMTTGTFTSDARAEAVRDGVTAIELIDGERLIDMFESLELGLAPKTVYEIDEAFFEEFCE